MFHNVLNSLNVPSTHVSSSMLFICYASQAFFKTFNSEERVSNQPERDTCRTNSVFRVKCGRNRLWWINQIWNDQNPAHLSCLPKRVQKVQLSATYQFQIMSLFFNLVIDFSHQAPGDRGVRGSCWQLSEQPPHCPEQRNVKAQI